MKKNNALFPLIFLIVFFFNIVSAQAGAWEFFGWYGGGCFPDVAFDPANPERLYLASDVTGIFRSDDKGESWNSINEGLTNLIVADVAVAPSDSNVVYAATQGGLHCSRDAGLHWQLASAYEKDIVFERPGNYHAISIHPAQPNEVLIGTKTGAVLRSEDFGKNWKRAGDELYPFGAKVSISGILRSPDGLLLYVISKEGIARLTLGEDKWQRLSPQIKKVTDLVFSGESGSELYLAGNEALWVSEDKGETWTGRGKSPRGFFYRLAVSPQGKLFAAWIDGWNSGVVISEDKGFTWQKKTKKIVADKSGNPSRSWKEAMERVTALKLSPHDPATLFYTDFWGVFCSVSGGEEWQEKITGAVNVAGSDLALINDSVYVATMDNGLLRRSVNEGRYESLAPKGKYDPEVCGHIWRVMAAGERVIATNSPWANKINQILLSEDSGATFEVVREGLPESRPKTNTVWGEGYPRALAVDPQNPMNVYLGIDGDDGGGLFISKDGGKCWAKSEGQPKGKRIYNGLVVDPTDSNRIYWGATGENGGVYVSQDQGVTWSKTLSEMSWVFDLAVTPEGVIFAGGSKGATALYISKNQGKHWELCKKFEEGSSVEAIAIDSSNSKRIALGTIHWGGTAPGKFYLSEDAGKNWADISDGLPAGSGAAAMKFSEDGQWLYMIRYAGSVYRYKITLA